MALVGLSSVSFSREPAGALRYRVFYRTLEELWWLLLLYSLYAHKADYYWLNITTILLLLLEFIFPTKSPHRSEGVGT